MRISDWSSDVCSSDLADCPGKRRSVKPGVPCREVMARRQQHIGSTRRLPQDFAAQGIIGLLVNVAAGCQVAPISLALILAICGAVDRLVGCKGCVQRSDETTSAHQYLMRILFTDF